MPTVKSPIDADQQDRTLTVIVTPTLVWRNDGSIGATIAFSQGNSNPNMPNRVNPANGNISLQGMPRNANYNDNVDITLTLDTSQCKDRNGNAVVARWAYATEGNPPDDVGYCWFVANPQPGQPKNLQHIAIDGMTVSRIDDTNILIDDDTADGSDTYTFCMGFVLPDYSNYYITIDPVISGKGTSTNSFMLAD